MSFSIWGATIIGLCLGAVTAYLGGRSLLLKLVLNSSAPDVMAKFGVAGIIISFVPALLLSVVVGGTLGSSGGSWLFDAAGMPVSGVPLGMGLGIAVVFATVLVGGTAACIFAGRALIRHARGGKRG